MSRPLFSILLDGAFLAKRLYAKSGRHVIADDVVTECDRLRSLPCVQDYELLRICYYDGIPLTKQVTRPVSRTQLSLGEIEEYRHVGTLHAQLALKPHFALRLGNVSVSSNRWRLKPSVARQLIKELRPLTDDDFVIDAVQKGVDMRLGVDMAQLALRELVRTLIVVTGDTDFIPAFKLARREGVKVILEPMGTKPAVALRAHSDIVI